MIDFSAKHIGEVILLESKLHDAGINTIVLIKIIACIEDEYDLEFDDEKLF